MTCPHLLLKADYDTNSIFKIISYGINHLKEND